MVACPKCHGLDLSTFYYNGKQFYRCLADGTRWYLDMAKNEWVGPFERWGVTK